MSGIFNPEQALAPARTPSVPQPVAGVNNAFFTDLQDESVKAYEFEVYKGRLNHIDRIYLIRPKHIAKIRRHYHEKLKYVLCNSKYTRKGEHEVMTYEAACCKLLPSNSLQFAALIIRYLTEKNGTIIQGPQGLPTPEARLWRFGVDKYLNLKAIDGEFPLHQHDLQIQCTEEGYQKLTIGATQSCIYMHPQFPADIKQQFEDWANLSIPKIVREMGRQMSDADIQKELGVAGASAPQMLVADQPIMSFDQVVGGGAGPAIQPGQSATAPATAPAAPAQQPPVPTFK